MKKHKLLSVVLAFLFLVFVAPWHVAKSDDVTTATADTIKTSQIDGVSFTQKGTTGGGLLLEQHALAFQMDMSNATYFAIRYYNPTGAAWPFYFICQQNGGFIYLADNAEYYVYNDNFELVETKNVMNRAIAPTVASSGYIVMPASVFADIATIEAFYITLPAAAEAQIGVTELHFAKLAYYTTNPTNANEFATQMITLTDFSTWTEAWFAGRITDVNGVDVQLCKRPSYTVTEIVDGVQTNKTVQQGESYAPVAPTKENASFIGWKYTDASNTTGEIKTSSFTVTADCTVEALFVEFEKLGVSIKTAGTQGLRFKNQVKAESVALLEELGLTATYGTKLTHDTLGTQHIATENWLDVDNKVFAAVLTFDGVENVESYYDDVFTATAYVEINGVKYYANATQSASLAYVANLAVNDSNTNYSEAERSYLATIAAYYQA